MKKLKSPSLTHSERRALRSDFLSKTGLDEAPPSYFMNMLPRYATVTAYSLLLVLAGLSPIAFAAESSEPGDILYPIKTTVNEPVKKAVRAVVPPYRPTETERPDKEVSPADESDRARDTSDIREDVTTLPILKGETKDATKEAKKSKNPIQDIPVVQDVIIEVNDAIPILKDAEKTIKKEKRKEQKEDEKEDDETQETVEEALEVPKKVIEDAKDAIENTVPKINLSL